MFKSLIYLGLIFVYKVRCWIQVSFCMMWAPSAVAIPFASLHGLHFFFLTQEEIFLRLRRKSKKKGKLR